MGFEDAIMVIRGFMDSHDDLEYKVVKALTKAVDSMDYLNTYEEELDEEI